MARVVLLLCGFAFAAGACSSEVLIARNDRTGEAGAGGSGGAPSAGTGGMPSVAGTAGHSESGSGGSGGTEPMNGAAGSAEPVSRVLADSVLDFTLEQDKYGWSYGYDAGSIDTFTRFSYTSTIRNYMPPSMDAWQCWAIDDMQWTQIFQFGAHPNGTTTNTPSKPRLQRAVRRWTSTYAGPVVIAGEIAKIDVSTKGVPSNGIDAFVFVDGNQAYTTFIAGDDSGGRAYQLPITTLQVGSTVDFVLDPHDGHDSRDLTRFTAVIARAETE